jgi:hypothetical protein
MNMNTKYSSLLISLQKNRSNEKNYANWTGSTGLGNEGILYDTFGLNHMSTTMYISNPGMKL